MRAFFINAEKGRCSTVDIDTRQLSRLLRCDNVEYCYASVGGRTFAIACDRERWIKSGYPSAFDCNGGVRFIGNIAIVGRSGEEPEGLGKLDLNVIQRNLLSFKAKESLLSRKRVALLIG